MFEGTGKFVQLDSRESNTKHHLNEICVNCGKRKGDHYYHKCTILETG